MILKPIIFEIGDDINIEDVYEWCKEHKIDPPEEIPVEYTVSVWSNINSNSNLYIGYWNGVSMAATATPTTAPTVTIPITFTPSSGKSKYYSPVLSEINWKVTVPNGLLSVLFRLSFPSARMKK